MARKELFCHDDDDDDDDEYHCNCRNICILIKLYIAVWAGIISAIFVRVYIQSSNDDEPG
jgi:hypothetical protein